MSVDRTHEKGQTVSVGSGDWLAILRDAASIEAKCEPTRFDVLAKAVTEIETLRQKLAHLIEVIEAHEIESLSCDRDGNVYCDCLRNAAKDAKRFLANTKAEP